MIKVGDWLKKAASGASGGLLEGVSSIISRVKADPTKVAEIEQELEELKFNHLQEMAKLDLEADKIEADLEKAYLADKDSARDREIQIATSEKAPLLNKIITPLLAILILGSTFIFWYILIFVDITKDKEILLSGITGSLTTLSMGVVGYYFGSSQSSANKQKQIESFMTK